HRDIELRRIKVLPKPRPQILLQAEAHESLVVRRALYEMQNVAVAGRNHVAVCRKVWKIRQQAERHETLVRPEHMEIVGEIVGGKLPGALDLPDLRHADDLDLAGAAEDDVEVPAHVAEPFAQRGRMLVPARKNETAVAIKPRDRNET